MGVFDLKIGSSICVMGATGSGKTPLVKELIKDIEMQKVAFDKRFEYDSDKFTIFRTAKNFEAFFPKIKSSIIVWEEATPMISGYKDSEIMELLISIQHFNNICFFIFHSLMDTPPFILRNCSYVIQLRTADDNPNSIKSQRPRYYNAFMERNFPYFYDNTEY